MTVIGYIVLTRQPDGRWLDDWDGEIHETREEGDFALEEARDACGEDVCCLATLVWSEPAA